MKKKASGGRTSSNNKNKERERPKVQVLYETCKEVFQNCGPGIIPSPQNIQRLKDIMGIIITLFLYIYMLLLLSTAFISLLCVANFLIHFCSALLQLSFLHPTFTNMPKYRSRFQRLSPNNTNHPPPFFTLNMHFFF